MKFRCANFVENYYNGYKELTKCPLTGIVCKGFDSVMPCYKMPILQTEINFDFD